MRTDVYLFATFAHCCGLIMPVNIFAKAYEREPSTMDDASLDKPSSKLILKSPQLACNG